MEIVVVNKTRKKLNEKNITKQAHLCLKGLLTRPKLKNKSYLKRPELTLVFVGREAMRKLNFQYRGKNRATDVLSFDSVDNFSLGELVFCWDVLVKQAKEHQHSVEAEWVYMLIHGLLHLLGYDHELQQKSAKEMFEVQDKLFSQLTQQKIKLKLLYVDRNRARRN